MKVASELGIPIFTILAPDRKTITPGLMPSQPWWDFDPTLPEEVKAADALHGAGRGRTDAKE